MENKNIIPYICQQTKATMRRKDKQKLSWLMQGKMVESKMLSEDNNISQSDCDKTSTNIKQMATSLDLMVDEKKNFDSDPLKNPISLNIPGNPQFQSRLRQNFSINIKTSSVKMSQNLSSISYFLQCAHHNPQKITSSTKKQMISCQFSYLREVIENLQFNLISLKAYYEDYLQFERKNMMEALTHSIQQILSIIEDKNQELFKKINFYQRSYLQKSNQLKQLEKQYKIVLYEKSRLQVKNTKLCQQISLNDWSQVKMERKFASLRSSLQKRLQNEGCFRQQEGRNRTLTNIETMKDKLKKMKRFFDKNGDNAIHIEDS